MHPLRQLTARLTSKPESLQVSMPDPEKEPLLASGRMSLPRKDSEPDMMLRLSHDAQPANMLQRLSADSRLRSR